MLTAPLGTESVLPVDDTPPPTDPVPTDTMTLPVLPGKAVERSFRVLEIEEMSDEEIREVNLQITAIVRAEQLRTNVTKKDPPSTYRERFYVWKMVFQQMISTGAVILVIFLLMLTQSGSETGEMQGWAAIALIISLVLYAWFSYRTYYAWRHTYVFSEDGKTGIERRDNRWLFLPELRRTNDTLSLQTKIAKRRYPIYFFGLNSWVVTLDAPAEQDKFLIRRGFIRNGDLLVEAVESYQKFIRG